VVILELIRATTLGFLSQVALIRLRTNPCLHGCLVIHNNLVNRIASASDSSHKFLTYQLSTVGYWPTVAMTGNGELGFDSGEGA
jgi:hypothetical protein